MSATIRAWLFVRGRDTVRIEIDGSDVTVHGPAGRFSRSRFGEELAATLHQSAIEQALVLDGWTLEQITTERRAAQFEAPRGARPSSLRLTDKTEG